MNKKKKVDLNDTEDFSLLNNTNLNDINLNSFFDGENEEECDWYGIEGENKFNKKLNDSLDTSMFLFITRHARERINQRLKVDMTVPQLRHIILEEGIPSSREKILKLYGSNSIKKSYKNDNKNNFIKYREFRFPNISKPCIAVIGKKFNDRYNEDELVLITVYTPRLK